MTERPEDKRAHARLQARLEIQIRDARGSRGVELRDLSQGGASLFSSEEPGEVGSMIELGIPGPEYVVGIDAELVRVSKLSDGYLLGLKFSIVQTNELEAVDYLLGVLLSGRGGGVREHPRIAQRITVPCETPQQMLAMVENISMGGLALNIEVLMEVGAEIIIVLPADDGQDLLSLQCHVANVRVIEDSEPVRYLVGLSFDSMSPQRRIMLDALLVSLLKSHETSV